MKNHLRPIDPDSVYAQTALAEALEVSNRWLLDNLITPRQIRFKKVGRLYLFLGKWVADFVQADHQIPAGDDNEE